MHGLLDKKISEKLSEIERNARIVPDLEKTLDDMTNKDDIEHLEKYIQYVRSGQEEVDFLIDLIPIAKKYDEDVPQSEQGTDGIFKFVQVESKQASRTLLRKFEKKDDDAADASSSSKVFCSGCGGLFRFSRREATRTCVECGLTEMDEDTWIQNVSYNDEITMTRTSSYAYKKINHFAEWLASVQAKEKTTIPESVLDALRVEYKKIRVTKASQITAAKTKEFLKKLKMTKYYEHVHYITELLSGIPPISIPTPLEDKLKMMFHEIQEPWEKTKPANRSNFFSYSYVLHKFCELLGEDEYLPLFPLLKSSQKLYQQDQMWKSVCVELGWEFISSV